MSKEYWNGVLNRLPNFLDRMGKMCMQVSMMDYQMRNSCCHGGSIFGMRGMYSPYGYPSLGGCAGGFGGMAGHYGSYWDNQGMMSSIYGNLPSQSSGAYTPSLGAQNSNLLDPEDPEFFANINRVIDSSAAQTTSQTQSEAPSPAPSQNPT